MQKLKLNANAVGTNCIRPHFEGMTLKNQNGITLIALIITIIVMLVLVGVTINVALTGGLFEKGEKAAYQSNVATIQEKLAIKKAEVLADHNGKSQEDYKITFAQLELTGNLEDLKTQLAISKDGNLYYIEDEVNEKEKAWLEEIGITKYTGGTIPPLAIEPPTLELVQIDAGTYTDHTLIGLNIEFNSFEQMYSVAEQVYAEDYDEEEADTLEQWLITCYNDDNGTNCNTVQDTGKTLEELTTSYFLEGADYKMPGMGSWLFYRTKPTFSIKRPDNSTATFTCGESYSPDKALEGIYNYHSLSNLECNGYCYSATQTGTYEISITIAGYTITDTITIENF